MKSFKARPLEALDFRFRPLAPHALAWSCDAELAVALDDAIHVFMPEYPREAAGDNGNDEDSVPHQFSVSLQASGIIRPEPSINAKLCASAGVKLPTPSVTDEFSTSGVGNGLVTGSGAALGQTVRVEWSPNGVGHNLRPVLTVLTTHGSVVTLGEHIDSRSAKAFSATARSFRNWQVLWGLGARLPIPDAKGKPGVRHMDDKIVSFSWAREILPRRALLAYATGDGDVVIMSVQFFLRAEEPEPSAEQEPVWKIGELARFDGRGCHKMADPGDPDFVPHGSGFSLKWSPWHVSSELRTATLAYVSNNYVGFRRITIRDAWEEARDPILEVEQMDTMGICMPLSADAFVEWEDAVWPDGHGQMARGIIATPFAPKPFQVDLCGSLAKPIARHSTSECSSTYAQDGDASTNPITGLVVHRPDAHKKPPTPRYSLVRLSATATNDDWYQTNWPEAEMPLPQWATYVKGQAARLVPRLAAMQGFDSDSDSDDLEEEYMIDEAPMSRVHPHRFRFWGLASSPGGGCTAVLATRHSTQHPYRRALSRVLFGWHDRTGEAAPRPRFDASRKLTTEGQLWEAVYGNQGEVGDILPVGTAAARSPSSPLGQFFNKVIPRQRCVFCDAPLTSRAEESACETGHSFATCAATGLAIMAPGTSRLCAVCGLRCLNVAELSAIARRHTGTDAVVDPTGGLCGGCGAKFVA